MKKQDDDFGFSLQFMEEGAVPIEQTRDLIKFKDDALNELRAMVMPFLQKMANSKGDIIKWPYTERQKQITDFMKKIDAFTDTAIARKRGFTNVGTTEEAT